MACKSSVWAAGFTLLTLARLAPTVHACNVPVFRYALEHWPADSYEVIFFHRGPLNPADQTAVAALKKHAEDRASGANLHFHRVDLSQPHEAALASLFQAQTDAQLPWLVVRYPETAGIEENVWAGRLSREVVQALLDSPTRREIARRILQGESAVWVLLETGDEAKDNAARRLLETQLRKLQQSLKLPEWTAAPADRVGNEEVLPLRLAFSTIHVARQDPAEKLFVPMLLASEADLAERSEPIVFPIFGRGRLLYALVGKGITAENLAESANYVIGACSCEVKRQHPGVDLLMSTDWDAALEGRALPESEPPALVGLSQFTPPADVAPVAETPESRPDGSSVLVRNLLLALLIGLLVLSALTFLLLRTRRP